MKPNSLVIEDLLLLNKWQYHCYLKLSRLEHSEDGRHLGTTLMVAAKDSAQISVHIYRTVRVTYQKERNLPFKTNFRTIDLCTNADIKLQVALPLPTTCLGFLDVSASL